MIWKTCCREAVFNFLALFWNVVKFVLQKNVQTLEIVVNKQLVNKTAASLVKLVISEVSAMHSILSFVSLVD